MNLYQPEVEEKIGIALGSVIGIMTSPVLLDTVLNTIVGASVGFIVTTFLRFIWEKFVNPKAAKKRK